MNTFVTILRGCAQVFRERLYIGIATVGTVLFFGFYLLIPVWIVPATTLAFEIGRLTPANYFLLGSLALMTGLLLSLEIFSFRRARSSGLVSAGESGVGFAASFAGGILIAASCGCGTGILLGVIGLGGGALFIAKNQILIAVLMLGVVAVGLYFSARRAAGICATCHV